jgi:hypothetical protein
MVLAQGKRGEAAVEATYGRLSRSSTRALLARRQSYCIPPFTASPQVVRGPPRSQPLTNSKRPFLSTLGGTLWVSPALVRLVRWVDPAA